MSSTSRPLRHAFTLIELLVAITIIATLAALLLPSIATARAMAQGVDCSSRLRQLGIGMIAFAGDNDDLLPFAKQNTWPGQNTGLTYLGQYFGFANSWSPWLKAKILQCPSGRKSNGDSWFDFAPTYHLLGLNKIQSGQPRRTRLVEITYSSQTILLAEILRGTPWWVPCVAQPDDFWSGWVAPHRGRGNFLMADGHVEAHRYSGPLDTSTGRAMNTTMWDVPISPSWNGAPLPGGLYWSRQQLGLTQNQ